MYGTYHVLMTFTLHFSNPAVVYRVTIFFTQSRTLHDVIGEKRREEKNFD